MSNPIINQSYRLVRCERRALDFELWSVAFVRGRSQNEVSRGLLLLVPPNASSNGLVDIWKKWRELYKNDGCLAKCTASDIIKDETEYNGYLFVYIPTSDIQRDFSNESWSLLDIPNFLQSIATLQDMGLTCAKLEDWMFVSTVCGEKRTWRLMPTHHLRASNAPNDLLKTAGNYLQQRYPNLPQPWGGLLRRLLDNNNPPDIKLFCNQQIWDSAHEISRLVEIKTQKRGREHVFTWCVPQGKTVFVLRASENRMTRLQENAVYFRNEILSWGHEIPTIDNSATIKIEATEIITVIPFIVSGPLFQCLPQIVLNGTEYVGIKGVYWDDRSRELVLDIDWPPDVGSGVVVVGNEFFVETVTDVHEQIQFKEQIVRQTVIQPVRCFMKFSEKFFITVFSCHVGRKGPVYSMGQRHLFEFFTILRRTKQCSRQEAIIVRANCHVTTPNLNVVVSATGQVVGSISSQRWSRGQEVSIRIDMVESDSSFRLIHQH